MIDHFDQGNDESTIANLKARLPVGTADAELIAQELSAHHIQARDQDFGTAVTMNLVGELVDINLPPLYSDHYEDAWDKAAASISATAVALQKRARSISTRVISSSVSSSGAADVG